MAESVMFCTRITPETKRRVIDTILWMRENGWPDADIQTFVHDALWQALSSYAREAEERGRAIPHTRKRLGSGPQRRRQ